MNLKVEKEVVPLLRTSNNDDDDNDPSIIIQPMIPSSSSSFIRSSLSSFLLSKGFSVPQVQTLREARKRSIFLSMSLFLILMTFWILDSLKDPLFASLLESNGGSFESSQPTAKMASVLSTLLLVYFLEAVEEHQDIFSSSSSCTSSENQDMGQESSKWKKMRTLISGYHNNNSDENNTTSSVITYVNLPYTVIFLVIALVLKRSPTYSNNEDIELIKSSSSDTSQAYVFLAYALYVAIESFGSLSVAAFWSYTNTNLNLEGAKQNYGMIISVAQLGAIFGSTIVASTSKDEDLENGDNNGSLSSPKEKDPFNYFIISCIFILLNVGLMKVYHQYFSKPLPQLDEFKMNQTTFGSGLEFHKDHEEQKEQDHQEQKQKSKSGLHLVLRHNYLLCILGVSCLYEIALTCIDYEMKLLGLARFQNDALGSTFDGQPLPKEGINFKTFMGRYGQFTNVLSLLLSFFIFPLMMNKYGVRKTLWVFPILLITITVLIFTFITPENNDHRSVVWILFCFMAMLKAMTYSINDPVKEILYMPTSPEIKVKGKFWIDVVGARCAKAIGSGITNYAGNAERLIQFGRLPSILSSIGLLYLSIKVGEKFECLVETGDIVGCYDDNDIEYSLIDQDDEMDFAKKKPVDDIFVEDVEEEQETPYNMSTTDDESGWESNTTIELVNTRRYTKR